MARTIRPANLRDMTFILANIREIDRAELFCQVEPGISNAHLAYTLLLGSSAWIAYIDGQPVAAFGIGMINMVAASAWAFGTKRMSRLIPLITDFLAIEVIPDLIDAGVRIMEARSMVGHHEAHRWLLWTGATIQGEPFPFGRDGEQFLLFRWTVSGYHSIRRTKRRWHHHSEG